MVKWGRRLIGGGKATTKSSPSPNKFGNGGRGTPSGRSPYYDRREQEEEYYDSEDSCSYVAEEDPEVPWDDERGEFDEDDPSYYEEDVDGEIMEGRDDDRQRELVTRDQVLGELRAQAAADALGKSLEQMGYNLDNCDSFYSLSDNEAENAPDNRYKIQDAPEKPVSKKSKSAADKASRRGKVKKKKGKTSNHSRYSIPSDDEDEEDEPEVEESTMYGGHARRPRTTRRKKKYQDYETTVADSSSDESKEEDLTMYEDETSFTTGGRDSFVTGKTSRISRLTRKKSPIKARKPTTTAKKPKKQKRRIRDNDTVYTEEGTECTPADSSYYGKTVDESSTFSSVSLSDVDSELEETETAYSEVINKRETRRRPRQKSPKHTRRGMRAIDEEELDLDEMSSSSDNIKETLKKERRGEKKVVPRQPKRKPIRKTESRNSESSQIGALRSFDSFSDNASEDDEPEHHGRARKGKTDRGSKETSRNIKKAKDEFGPEGDADDDKVARRRNSRHKHRSAAKMESGLSDSDEASENSSDSKKKHPKRYSHEGKPRKLKDSEVDDAENGSRRKKRISEKELSDKKESLSTKDEDEHVDEHSERGHAHKKTKSKTPSLSKKKSREVDSSSSEAEHEDERKTEKKEKSHAGKKKNRVEELLLSSDSEHGQTVAKKQKPHSGASKTSKRGELSSSESEHETKSSKKHKSVQPSSAAVEHKTRPSDDVAKENTLTLKDTNETATKQEETQPGHDAKSIAESHHSVQETSNTDSAHDGTKQPQANHKSKKFWPRHFLNLRKKNKIDPVKKIEEEKPQKQKVEENVVKENKEVAEESNSLKNESLSTLSHTAEHTGASVREHTSSREPRGRSSSPSPKESKDGRSPEKINRERSRSRSRGPDGSIPSKKSKGRGDSIRSGKSKRRESLTNNSSDFQKILPSLSQDSDAFSFKENKPVDQGPLSPTNGQVCTPPTGLFALATMAAMIPLAPLAAAYTCYKAEGTQSLMQSVNCADGSSIQEEDKHGSKERDDDDHTHHTRSSRKSRKSNATVRTSERSTKSSKSRRSSRNEKSNEGSSRSGRDSVRDSVHRDSVRPDRDSVPQAKISSPKSSSPKSRKGSFSPLRGHFSKATPHRAAPLEDPDLPKTQIEEAAEGFESFLPKTFDTQCLVDAAELTGYAFSPVAKSSKQASSAHNASEGDTPSQAKNKKLKRWIPKLHFGSNKKTHDSVEYPVEASDQTTKPETNGENKNQAPDRLPFLKLGKKSAAPVDNLSTSALQSNIRAVVRGPAPTNQVARPQRRVLEEIVVPNLADQEDFGLFSCSKASTACAQIAEDDDDDDDLDIDNSLLSEFEGLALDALHKKKWKQKKKEFNASTASREEILKYYDLGQTLSDVMDARQTLENAYGLASGGGSFDHTIDEQLVELLTHMAEMDQNDVVEIEAAIKKLKKHARKLGISERDLLFSVKSAEESALSLNNDDYDLLSRNRSSHNRDTPNFGERVLDAFEGYFGRK